MTDCCVANCMLPSATSLIMESELQTCLFRHIDIKGARQKIHPCHSMGEEQPFIKSRESAGKWIENINN